MAGNTYEGLLIIVGILALALPSVQAAVDVAGPTVTPWGEYGPWGRCPKGYYVYGVRLAVEREQGARDDTGLNDIELLCRQFFGGSGGYFGHSGNSGKFKHVETVQVPRAHGEHGGFGEWGPEVACHENREAFVVGIQLKIEAPVGKGDDTAANDVRLICSNGVEVQGNGTPWGEWRDKMICPRGLKVCGMRTKIEKYRGPGIASGDDDSAVNTIDIRCCR